MPEEKSAARSADAAAAPGGSCIGNEMVHGGGTSRGRGNLVTTRTSTEQRKIPVLDGNITHEQGRIIDL